MEQKKRLKVAIVTNWFGKELKGGAEQQAWQMATRLSQHVDVEVLTTCSQSFHSSWDKNYYKEGVYPEEGFVVRRFVVNKRTRKQIQAFNRLVGQMLAMDSEQFSPGITPLSEAEEEIYVNCNIGSQNLLNHLEQHKNDYDHAIFLPYLFPLSIKGSQIMGEKACLQPCLHDEVYAYLRCVQTSLSLCGLIFFNSKGEEILAQRLFGSFILHKSTVVGEGVEVSQETVTNKEQPLIAGPYLLYLGKRCKEKNVDLLIASFDRFAKSHPSTPWKLVLAGADSLPLKPLSPQVVDMGMVSESVKANLLANCRLVVNLSINESFSRLIFEGWFAAKPVLIHQDCLATATALDQSASSGFAVAGGWQVGGLKEAWEFFCSLESLTDEQIQLRGQAGKTYARSIAIWDDVMQRYLKSWLDHKQKKNRCQIITLIITDNASSTIETAAAYASLSIQAGYKVEALAPFVLRHSFLGSLQIEINDLKTDSTRFLKIGSTCWFDVDQLLSRLKGEKIQLCKSVLETSMQDVWKVKTAFPILMESFDKRQHTISYDQFLKDAQHHTFRVAIACYQLSGDLCDFLENLAKSHATKANFPIEIFLFVEQRSFESFPNLLPEIKQVLFFSDALVSELIDRFISCDAALIYGQENFFPWDALSLGQSYEIPFVRVLAQKNADFSLLKPVIGFVSYESSQLEAILKALYALESSELMREGAVRLLSRSPLRGEYQSSFAKHMKEC